MMKGKVLAYHRAEGYAFIRPIDVKGRDIFMHMMDVRHGRIDNGVIVEYELKEHKGKTKAANVRVVDQEVTALCP